MKKERELLIRKRKLEKDNLKFALIGAGIMLVGLFLSSLVGDKFHGPLALITVATIITGIVTIILSLALDI